MAVDQPGCWERGGALVACVREGQWLAGVDEGKEGRKEVVVLALGWKNNLTLNHRLLAELNPGAVANPPAASSSKNRQQPPAREEWGRESVFSLRQSHVSPR